MENLKTAPPLPRLLRGLPDATRSVARSGPRAWGSKGHTSRLKAVGKSLKPFVSHGKQLPSDATCDARPHARGGYSTAAARSGARSGNLRN